MDPTQEDSADWTQAEITAGAALADPGKDELGRRRYATHLAQALVRYQRTESLVVALYGRWGTGKTTLLNFTETALQDLPDDQRPIVIRFNPWNYSNQAELVAQFFDCLSVALKRKDLAEKYENASNLLEALSRRTSLVETIPYLGNAVGPVVKPLGWVAGVFSKGLKKEASDERDLSAIKTKISAELEHNNRKIVIILDDIDRLSSVEIRQIFQLVKALADFSNVMYLLAFDRAVIVNALAKVQEGSGESYLEKIVNVPIELPQLTSTQIQNMLTDRIKRFGKTHPRYQWWQNAHFVSTVEHLRKRFSTIRALDRFSNVLLFNDGLIDGEVDYADFIAICALQVTNPALYHFIRDNEELFVHSPLRTVGARSDHENEDRENIEAGLAEVCDPADVQLSLDQLMAMFPRLQQLFGRRAFGDNERSQWERERRICANSEVFQTYFQLAVPVDGFSARRLDEILSDLRAEPLETSLNELINENRGVSFLRELENYVDDPRVLEHASDVCRVLFNLGDAFADDLGGFPIKLDGPTLIMRIVYHVTRRLSPEEVRFQCLRDAIVAAEDGLFSPVQTVSVEDQTAGRYGLGGREDPSKRLVFDDHLDELEALCRTKIEAWAADGRLATHANMPYILYRWSNWGGGDAVQAYVLGTLSDEQFVRLFARIGFGTAQSQLLRKPHLFGAEVEALAPLAAVQERLRDIAASVGRVETLPADLQTALIALLDPADELT